MLKEQKIRQNPTLGSNISKIRNDRDLTQEQLAARLQLYGSGISRSILSQIECGTYNVRAADLVIMSKVLKVEIAAFFEGLEP